MPARASTAVRAVGTPSVLKVQVMRNSEEVGVVGPHGATELSRGGGVDRKSVASGADGPGRAPIVPQQTPRCV